MIETDPPAPAVGSPTKPIGPIYTAQEAIGFTAEKGCMFKSERESMRRAVRLLQFACIGTGARAEESP